jgi:ATP-dependent helicase/nuclease subunit A
MTHQPRARDTVAPKVSSVSRKAICATVSVPREPLAPTHPEGAHVVRLMTIHQAKGLEFPIVFVPDLGRGLNSQPSSVEFDSRLGPLVKEPSGGKREKRVTGLDLFRWKSEAEDQAESMRLLYVAATRAADHLVLSSGVSPKELQSPSGPWMKLLAERFDLMTGQLTVSLPDADGFGPPAVKVTMTAPSREVVSGSTRSWHDLDAGIDRAIQIATDSKRESTASDAGQRFLTPIAVDCAARRRFSVSRLSGELQLDAAARATITLAPADDDLAAVSAIDLGTLVHEVLAGIPMQSRVDVPAWVTQCMPSGDEKIETLQSEAKLFVESFLKSARAAELAAAKQVHRELEFLLVWPPNQPIDSSQPTRYLQGFIDCLYQDARGRWEDHARDGLGGAARLYAPASRGQPEACAGFEPVT